MSMIAVNAMRDLGSVGKGASNAHFFYCDDGNEYLVKFIESNPTKTAINELVGGSLALKIKLPTPDISLVNISQNLIDLSDKLKQRNIPTGNHIGIKRLPKDTLDFQYLTDDMLIDKTLGNNDALYGVVNFDNWVLNTDRNNPGNNMIEFLPNKKIKYHMIDFGHCFTGSTWNQGLEQSKNNENLMAIFPFIRRWLINIDGFDSWFKAIECMPDNEIDEIVNSIPLSWNLQSSEKDVLLNIIKNRKHLVRKIIYNNKVSLNLDG